MTELEKLREASTLWARTLNKQAEVEAVLFEVAAGKRPPLEGDECRKLAIKLGVPAPLGDYRTDAWAKLHARVEALENELRQGGVRLGGAGAGGDGQHHEAEQQEAGQLPIGVPVRDVRSVALGQPGEAEAAPAVAVNERLWEYFNLGNARGSLISPSRLTQAFAWSRTPQGHDFWNDENKRKKLSPAGRAALTQLIKQYEARNG